MTSPKTVSVVALQKLSNAPETSTSKNAKQRVHPPIPSFLTDLRFHDLRHEATSRFFFELGLYQQEI